jgi:hypothetical protein
VVTPTRRNQTVDEKKTTEPLPIGACVMTLNSGFKEPMTIVEHLGPLGPGGVRVYRVRFRRKPPGYTEVSEDQLARYMFLVEAQSYGVTDLVFLWEDPSKDGYKGNVTEGVTLDYDMAVHAWPDGQPAPEVCVGRAPDDPTHYKVFKYRRDLQAAGYLPVEGKAIVVRSWLDYLRRRPAPPQTDQIDNETAESR